MKTRSRFAAILISLIVAQVFVFSSCKTSALIEPPPFDYINLADRYFRANPSGHLPLTVQSGVNTDPAISKDGYLFYASNVRGSFDIYMRDLKGIVEIPVVTQATDQTQPQVSPDGKTLLYISTEFDSTSTGGSPTD